MVVDLQFLAQSKDFLSSNLHQVDDQAESLALQDTNRIVRVKLLEAHLFSNNLMVHSRLQDPFSKPSSDH